MSAPVDGMARVDRCMCCRCGRKWSTVSVQGLGKIHWGSCPDCDPDGTKSYRVYSKWEEHDALVVTDERRGMR